MVLSRSYNLHGLSLVVEARAMEVVREVDALLHSFAGQAKRSSYLICIEADYLEKREFRSTAPVLWDGELPQDIHATYRGDKTRRELELHGLSLARFDLASRRAQISIKPGAERSLVSGGFIPVLVEFLRQVDHHMIHAATLLIHGAEDRGLLISGASGAGKTTASLALVNSGMRLLSDDISFVTGIGSDAGSPRIWGLLPRLKVCRPSMELLPWIKSIAPPKKEGSREVYFEPATLRRTEAYSPVRPDSIVFLEERNAKEHRIWPLDRFSALSRLAKENISVIDRRGEGPSGKGLKAFASLVGSCKCFSLSASPRLETLYESLSPFLIN